MSIETPRTRIPCSPWLQFGSRYPGDPRKVALYDFLPDEKLPEVDNLHDFAGMVVFDKWTCNTDGRQTVFFETKPRTFAVPEEVKNAETANIAYRTVMIDQGFCFHAGEWNFPDAPLRGLYARNRVYAGVIGMESFSPWIERLEKCVTERVLSELAEEIPPAWSGYDYDALMRLLEQLFHRKQRVPELLHSAQRSNRMPFAYWKN